MVAASEDAVDVLVGQRTQVREASSYLSVSETQLPVGVAAADIDVAVLREHNGMVLTSCDLFDFLAQEILDKLWRKDVLRVPMSQLSVLPVTKGIETAVGAED